MPDRDQIHFGGAVVTLLNAGDLTMTLKETLNVAESVWRPLYAEAFERPQVFPSNSVLIQADGEVTLVDIGDYAGTVPSDSEWLPPGYTPPPGIPAQLAALGIASGKVRRVVITHVHWDHFAGTTTSRDGAYVATFANAEYLLGRADWENAETQAALADPTSLEARTLAQLEREGVLTRVEGDRALSASVSILSAPGESPGHQIVRVASEGSVLYCLGDLFHHPIEVEHPEWMAVWVDPAPMLASRRKVIDAALAEDARLVAAHLAGVGRLEATSDGARWVEV